MTLSRLVRLSAHLAYIQKEVLPSDNDQWLTLIPPSDQPPPPPADPDQPGAFDPPHQAIMERIKQKIPDEELAAFLRDEVIAADDGFSRLDVLRALLRVALFRAKASPFHTETIVARYTGCIGGLIREVGSLPEWLKPPILIQSISLQSLLIEPLAQLMLLQPGRARRNRAGASLAVCPLQLRSAICR
jgi:hypothetical protein